MFNRRLLVYPGGTSEPPLPTKETVLKYYYDYYHAHKAQRLEYAKQRREKLKAAGLCTQCGKRQQEKGLLCIECYKNYPINTSKQGKCPAFLF